VLNNYFAEKFLCSQYSSALIPWLLRIQPKIVLLESGFRVAVNRY